MIWNTSSSEADSLPADDDIDTDTDTDHKLFSLVTRTHDRKR
ncbi:hypothetical protein [Natrialba taiwanensis]|nr:hypothetical protein [Natrialba taiwanensis]